MIKQKSLEVFCFRQHSKKYNTIITFTSLQTLKANIHNYIVDLKSLKIFFCTNCLASTCYPL